MTDDKMREEFGKWWDISDDAMQGAGRKGPYSPLSPMQWSWETWQAACAHKDAEHAAEITALKSRAEAAEAKLAELQDTWTSPDELRTDYIQVIENCMRKIAEYESAEPVAYLINLYEGTKSGWGGKKNVTMASLEPDAPTIILDREKDIESRRLIKAIPLIIKPEKEGEKG